MVALAIPFGVAIGLAVGTLGGGGSVLAVPILVYVLGEPVREATTASLLIVAAGALTAGIRNAHDQGVCWGHAATFIVAAVPGLLAGTALGDAVGGGTLIAAFGVLMIVAAGATWKKTSGEDSPSDIDGARSCPPLRIARNLAAGLAVGVTTGFFGVGGGFVVVPTLAIGLALSMRLAIGTSAAIVAAISLIGLAVHLLAGRPLDPGPAALMAAACAVGALTGAVLSARVPQRRLGRGFAVALTAVAGYLLTSATFLGGTPGS
jgi:uncharacterized membrane protein YfcA